VISGRVNNRDGGQHQLEANWVEARNFFTGRDRLKDLFVAPDVLNFSWQQPYPVSAAPQKSADGAITDFCGGLVQQPYLGAFAGDQFCINAKP
jgi:hypothetical protein